jgi:hypothetical protein
MLQEDARAKLLHHLQSSGKHQFTAGIDREALAAGTQIFSELHEPLALHY